LQSQGVLGHINTGDLILVLAMATAGTVFLMWLGELISENGIGNGVSIIISVGIVAGLPAQVFSTAQIIDDQYILAAEIILAAIAMIAFIVCVNEAERRIKVSYARRIRAGRSVGNIDSYLPIKANAAGVVPIIFATSFLVFPGILAQYLKSSTVSTISSFAQTVERLMANEYVYGIAFFVLVFAFTFFYTSIIFQPNQMAENLQKQGGFIPGIRPGQQTARYLGSIIYKITFTGALFLSIIAIFPFVLQSVTGINTLAIGGTGILIIVSVTLDFVRQIKAHLAMRSYDDIYGL
jgi:preprotein translocase subunit SecY